MVKVYSINDCPMVPITTVNDKDYVLGFDKAKLDEMLGL